MAAGSSAEQPIGAPFFRSDDSPAVETRWGELFEIFAEQLDGATRRMRDAVPGLADVVEDVEMASRRYAAVIEGMCMQMSKQGRPLIAYQLVSGFTVLLCQQGPISDDDMEHVERAIQQVQTTVPEEAFERLLASALDEFFAANVQQGEVVCQELSGCDYIFVRDQDLEGVLKELNVGNALVLT